MRRTMRVMAIIVLCVLGQAVACMAADPEVKTSKDRDTLLYVRTVPPGAKVVLDGKELGTSDGVFHVEPGVGTIVVELDGHKPNAKQVTIRADGVTRVELKLEQQPGGGAPGESVVEGVGWNDVRVGMSREDLITALGKPDNDPASDWLKWRDKHIDCTFHTGSLVVSEVRLNPGFEGALANGIKLGSSESEMSKLYGEPENTLDRSNGAKKYEYSSKGILFWTYQGSITQIVVFKPYSPVAREPSDGGEAGESVVEGVGWGAFRVGATREELVKAFGEPERNSNPQIQWVRWVSKYHVDCLIDAQRGAYEVRFNEGFRLALTSGVRIGSPEKEVLAAYGAPDRVVNNPQAKMLEYDKRGVLMWVNSGKVSDFTVFKPKAAAEGRPKDVSDRAGQQLKARKRMQEDKRTFSDRERSEIESIYQVANKKWQTQEARDSLKTLVEKYKKANRTGCAILYLGQMSRGDEQIAYFKQAIADHSDCFYGDGVQVGAFARFLLGQAYLNGGKAEQAETLFNEIRTDYPDSVDHRGKSLVALLPNSGTAAESEPKAEQVGRITGMADSQWREFDLVVRAGRGQLTQEELQQLQKEGDPLVLQLADPNTKKLVELFANLPDRLHQELREAGYLKWKFTAIDPPSQKVCRDAIQLNLDMAKKQGAELPPTISMEALQKADVGIAIVPIDELRAKAVSWFVLFPEHPAPIWVTVVGTRAAGTPPYFAAHMKQLLELRGKQDSRPPSEIGSLAMPNDSVLDESQRLYRDWTEKYFQGMLNPSRFQNVSPPDRAAEEEQCLMRLSDGDVARRISDINALAALKSKKAVPGLLKIAAERMEKDNRDRWMAVRALGIIGDQSAVPELVHLTYHYNMNTRFWAKISLVRLTGQDFGRDVAAWKLWWEKQDGKPPISAETVAWATSEEAREWADPEKMDETDRKFVEAQKKQATGQSTGMPKVSGVSAPQIVAMNPPNGAKDVDPGLRELRVTFDTPMAGGFSWCGGGPNFPTGPKGKKPSWTEDRKTCILPVELKPNWEYRLGLNAPSFKNFRSAGGVPLEPVEYTFTTQSAASQDETAPKTEQVALITGMVDCRWADAAQGSTSAGVHLGRKFEIASGMLEITYNSGAKVILQGPATYETDSNGGLLSLGKLTGRTGKKVEGLPEPSNPQSTISGPFVVRTPIVTIAEQDSGNIEVGVEVSENGQAQVHVFRGKAKLQSVENDSSAEAVTRVLGEGESVRVQRDGSERVTLIAESSAHSVVREMPVAQHPTKKPQKEASRPKVISVSPAPNASGVDPVTEIRIRFDRPMDPNKMGLFGNPMHACIPFRVLGSPKYLAETNEFVVPVLLQPGVNYDLSLVHFVDKVSDFRSVDGVAAEGYSWQFATRDAPANADAPKPRVVSVDPPSKAQTGMVTAIRVRFDQPMDPEAFEPVCSIADEGMKDAVPGFVPFPVEYDASSNSFMFQALFLRATSPRVELRGFRGVDGGQAEPVMVEYDVGKKLYLPEQETRIAEAGRSAKLIEVVDAIRRNRLALKSLEETVRTVSLGSNRKGHLGWCDSLRVNYARFGFQGDRQFYADVSSIMEFSPSTSVSPNVFRLGSDGQECWFFCFANHTEEKLSHKSRVFCPFDAMRDQTIIIGDPFGSKRFASTEEAVAQLKLEYLGELARDGKNYHRVRSWVGEISQNNAYAICDWLIDAQSLLPAVCENSFCRHEFSYASINEPIVQETFQMPATADIQRKPFELEDGYDHFLLKACDGSDGRMSARWGQQGPKGTSSSGLN